MTRFKTGCLTAAGIALLAACASQPAPTKQMADSEAAIRAATELGAKGMPEAATHLQMAKDSMDKAEALSRKGENASAKRLLEEAKADAELAVLLTREQIAETNALAAQHELESASKSPAAQPAPQPAAQPSSNQAPTAPSVE